MKGLPHNTVVVCEGSSCRKQDSHRPLCKALAAAGYDVKTSPCLGVCSGPVVAAPMRDKVEIISEVRGAATIHKLTLALASGKAKKLSRVKGGRRDKARKRALKAVAGR